MGKSVFLVFWVWLLTLTTLVAQQQPFVGPKITSLAYGNAAKLAEQGNLTPLNWYFLADKNVYLCAITPNHFMLQGYYHDTVVNEVDRIIYDFKNAHIQQRCDIRGNCVGATHKIIEMQIISVDPISVFKWGDDLVQDNEVNNAVFDLTGLQGANYGIVSNTITTHAEVVVSNKDSLFFIKNSCTNSAMVSLKRTSGSIFDNDFAAEITVVMDDANVIVSDNNLSGAEKTFDITGAQGRFGGNNGMGNIWCRNCGPNTTILSANLFDGASIIADSMNAHVNAVELHRGSELHMVGSDSAFSKSFLDFTAIVHADGNKNRSEYNRFVGCRNGYGTHFYVTMTATGYLGNSSFYSCDTVMLDSTTQYNMQVFDSRKVDLETLSTHEFEVKGKVLVDVQDHHLRIMNLRSFANDEEAIKGGLSPYSLYINSQTGAINIVQAIIDP